MNIATDEQSFEEKRRAAVDFLDSQERTYVVDGFAGWAPCYRIKVRVICARAYHALFMRNSEFSFEASETVA